MIPRFALLAVFVWANAAACGLAAAPSDIALKGLTDPTGVAVRPAPRGGGVEVLIAAQRAVFASTWRDGEASPPEVRINGLPAEVTRLGWLSKKTLLVASTDVASYELPDEGVVTKREAIARAGSRGTRVGTVAANARFVYATGGDQLLRSRRVGKRLTAMRAVAADLTQPVAVVMSPLGYLVVLDRSPGDGAAAGFRLVYLGPEQPDRAGTAMPATGLKAPVQLAFRQSDVSGEGLLYVLDAERGVCRLDSAFDAAGQSEAVARTVVSVEQPTAFAVGPEGALYVASRADGGVVSRYRIGKTLE